MYTHKPTTQPIHTKPMLKFNQTKAKPATKIYRQATLNPKINLELSRLSLSPKSMPKRQRVPCSTSHPYSPGFLSLFHDSNAPKSTQILKLTGGALATVEWLRWSLIYDYLRLNDFMRGETQIEGKQCQPLKSTYS